MSSLKEKLDSKKHERAVTEHGEIFTIIPEHGEKTLTENRKFEESDKNLPYYWLKIIVCVFLT